MKEHDRPLAEGILFTDQYQLTMAQLYFRTGIHEKAAQFEHFFRNYPDYGMHKAGYCVNAGLECLECHGEVQNMAVIDSRDPAWGDGRMGWCIDCHRQEEASIDCAVCHY